jgi:rfaE bifunctional protein kinase chain/domain
MTQGDRIGLDRYVEILEAFEGLPVAVVGDLVADIYIYGKPRKLSREAPVMIVQWEQERLIPGSAGNSVNNLAVLGADVRAIGAIGDDEMGRRLTGILQEGGVDTSGLFVDGNLSTVTKTRILAGDLHTSKQQVIRIDRDPEGTISARTEAAVLDHLRGVRPRVKGLLISDYGYNFASPGTIGSVLQEYRDCVTVVDSRHRVAQYKGVWMVKPNESEAIEATGVEIESVEDAGRAGSALLEMTGARCVLLTRGNQGMILCESGKAPEMIPICGGEDIVDVSGAGDTVVSVALLALTAGGSFSEAARLANYAASVVVMKRGAATVTREELLKTIEKDLKKRGS